MSERGLPHNMETERAVLGGLLIGVPFSDVADRLRPDDFHGPRHRALYALMAELAAQGSTLDIMLVLDAIEARDVAMQMGGIAYVVALPQACASVDNVGAYADRLREHARRRRLRLAVRALDATIDDGSVSADDLLGRLDTIKREAEGEAGGGTWHAYSEIVPNAVQAAYDRITQPGSGAGLTTTIPEIDRWTGGLEPGRVYILAARPKMGKSAMLQQIIEANAAAGVPCGVFELEMSTRGWADRTLAHQSRVDSDKLRRGELTNEEWARLMSAGEYASGLPVWVDPTPRLPIAQIRSRARRLHAEKGVRLFGVDYLQLARAETRRGGSRENEVSEISQGLLGIAKELQVPVLALAQLNRACETRTNKRPLPSDLRESGQLEQDAHAIFLLYRDEVYNEDSPDKGIIEVIVGACRDGQTGTARCRFAGPHYRIDPLDLRHDDADRPPASRWASSASGYEY